MTSKKLSIKANMAWNSFGSLTNLGCQWLITILIVRLSTDYEAAGVFSLAASVYGIFSPIAQYRMYTYQISDIKNENSVGEYLAFRVVTNAISLMLCCIYSLITCSADAWAAIMLYGLYKAAMLMIDVLHACDQRHHRMDYLGKSLALQGFFSLLAFVAVFAPTQSLELSLIAMIVCITLIGIFYDKPRTGKLEALHFGISRKKTIYLLATCVSVVLAGLAASAMPSLPRQYLSFAYGNEALGIYASVAAPVAIIQMGASYIYNPLLGYFSERYFKRDKPGFIRLLLTSTAAIAAIGVVCAITLSIMGEPLLALIFGDSIRPHTYLLLPLTILAIATGYLWFVNDLLIALRDFRGTVLGSAVSLAVVLLTMVPFVQIWMGNGATFACLAATFAGIITMGICLWILVRKHWREPKEEPCGLDQKGD